MKGIVYPERITRSLSFTYQLPAGMYVRASAASNQSWPGIWRARTAELILLLAGLVLLTGALAMQKRLARNGLSKWPGSAACSCCFTVLFIGYYAQGQLSIVNLTGVIQALLAGRSLDYLMYDPMTVTLWAFVLLSLFAWGRGTFCGWLCPFGALQELTGKLGQALRFPQWLVRTKTDARLKLLEVWAVGGDRRLRVCFAGTHGRAGRTGTVQDGDHPQF
ncbi:4Fe-4S binding protein [Massilia sp. H-1]|nr:4Fe-4S binding protein [Massilia sp. H-1]